MRYHGALALASTWRRDVVPKPRQAVDACPRASGKRARTIALVEGTLLTSKVLSVRYWDTLPGGRLLASAARVDLGTLLRRTFEVDVLACPSCAGHLQVGSRECAFC